MKDTIHKAASATLVVTKPGKWYINRDICLWNDDAEMKVREKKRLYHKFLDTKTLANWQIYKNANREAKKAVAITRAGHWTLGMAREICIDLPKAEMNAHRKSYISVASMTRTTLFLTIVERRWIDGENTLSRLSRTEVLDCCK